MNKITAGIENNLGFFHLIPSVYNCHYEKIDNSEPTLLEDLPFEIPENWCWVRFSSLIKVISGVSYDKHDVCSKGIRILRGGNINNFNVTVEDDDVFLPEAYFDEEKQVQVNDILIVASTGSKLAIGKAGYIIEELENTQIGAFLRIVRPLVTDVAEYIKTIFATSYYKEHILDSIRGSNINNLKNEHISNLLIPLPPIDEQLRIVEYIKEIFSQIDLIENNQSEYNSLVESLKKAILQSAIQGTLVEQCEEDEPASVLLEKIRDEKKAQLGKKYIDSYIFKGDDNRYYEHIGSKTMDITQDIPFKLPSNWQWSKLKYIAFTQTGSTPPTEDEENFGDFIPFIKPGDIIDSKINYHNEGLSNKGLLNGRLIKKHSILMVCIGGSLGKCAILDRDVSCNQQINTATTNGSILPLYIFYVLNSDYFQSTAIEKATGNATPILNKSSWENIFIPVPPLAEQERIVSKINEIFAQL